MYRVLELLRESLICGHNNLYRILVSLTRIIVDRKTRVSKHTKGSRPR